MKACQYKFCINIKDLNSEIVNIKVFITPINERKINDKIVKFVIFILFISREKSDLKSKINNNYQTRNNSD